MKNPQPFHREGRVTQRQRRFGNMRRIITHEDSCSRFWMDYREIRLISSLFKVDVKGRSGLYICVPRLLPRSCQEITYLYSLYDLLRRVCHCQDGLFFKLLLRIDSAGATKVEKHLIACQPDSRPASFISFVIPSS